jgi:hypothetical protein
MSLPVSVFVAAQEDDVRKHTPNSTNPNEIVCSQCSHRVHSRTAKYCSHCGAFLAYSQSDSESPPTLPDSLCPSLPNTNAAPNSSPVSPYANKTYHSLPISQLFEHLDAHTRSKMDFSVRLWDKHLTVFEQCRAEKHSIKAAAAVYAEISKAEKTYANSLTKIVNSSDFKEIETVEGKTSSLTNAWNFVKLDLQNRSQSHSQFADILTSKVEAPLADMRKKLSTRKDTLESEINTSTNELKKAQDSLAKLQSKLEKLTHEFKFSGAKLNSKLTQADVDLLTEQVQGAQLSVFKAQNHHYRVLSDSLTSFEELSLERMEVFKSALFEARIAQSSMERQYLKFEHAQFMSITKIDRIKQLIKWVDINATNKECPWANSVAKSHPIDADPATLSFSPSPPPSEAPSTNPFSISPAVSSATPSPILTSASTPPSNSASLPTPPSSSSFSTPEHSHSHLYKTSHHQVPHKLPSVIVMPSTSPFVSNPNARRALHSSIVLSESNIAVAASSNPVISELTSIPSTFKAPSHCKISPVSFPFPLIGCPSTFEPLPPFSWIPTLSQLFPDENTTSLPDISLMTLSVFKCRPEKTCRYFLQYCACTINDPIK